MSFIRPEIAAGARKWREVLAGLVIILLAVILMRDSFGGRFWIGVLMAAFGVGLTLSGIPRARARTDGEGAGIIEVDEGRITYFGPLSGGSMALSDVVRIAADPERRWVLTSIEGEVMTIPMDAEGREALFDAFSALPGLSANRLANALVETVSSRRVIWARTH